ncbi:hypothetical protein HEP87_40485 [Streptomyces sp. S1D4-11]|nr:hypothetical protein [Streptomyces sp. S1D4-11]
MRARASRLATEAEFYDADTKLDVDSRGTVAVRGAEVPAKVTEHATTLWDGLGPRVRAGGCCGPAGCAG